MLFRQEVVESQKDRLHGNVVLSHPLSMQILVSSVFVLLAAAAVWVSYGTYARVETVRGILVTDVPSAKVIALQNGTISKLAVREGQKVNKGDTLFIIDSDRQTAEGGDVAAQGLDALDARKRLSETQVALAASRASAERSRLLTAISSAETQSKNLTDQIALQREVVASNRQIFDKVSSVMERGFISKSEFEQRRQALLSSQQVLASLQQSLTANLSEAQQARSQLAAVDVEMAQGVSQLQEGLQQLSAEEARLQGEQSAVVTAPIDGRVTAVFTAAGRSSEPGKPLMIIVPDNTKLTAELYAPTRAVGFVEPGKEARLLYDAFPYQRFGSFKGKVSSISRIAVDPRETDIPFAFEEPVYRIRVGLEQQSVDAYGKATPLQAGMTLQANIVLERQSFLNWMLQPLNAVLNRNA